MSDVALHHFGTFQCTQDDLAAQDTSQSQLQRLQGSAVLPEVHPGGPIMQSVFQAAAQQVFNSPPAPILPDANVGGPVTQSAFQAAAQQVFNSPPQPLLMGQQPELQPTPGSLGSVSLPPPPAPRGASSVVYLPMQMHE